jgi:hypothetical protein
MCNRARLSCEPIAALQTSEHVRMLGPYDLNGLHDPFALISRAAGLYDPVVPDVLPGRDADDGADERAPSALRSACYACEDVGDHDAGLLDGLDAVSNFHVRESPRGRVGLHRGSKPAIASAIRMNGEFKVA